MFALSTASTAALAPRARATARHRRGGARHVVSATTTPSNAPATTASDSIRAKASKTAAALMLSAAIALSHPSTAHALGGGFKSNNDVYAQMMKEMEEQRKAEGTKTLSAADMYDEQGGACGEGYELVVRKVLGASCECVADSCKDGAAEGSREVRTEAERSFGKQEDAPEAGSSGIVFTFQNKE